MKIKVIIESIIDTDKIPIADKNVKVSIEKCVVNQENNNLAKLWAANEVNYQNPTSKITLELL